MSKKVAISEIKVNVYVRAHLDTERVEEFEELTKAGTELPPIKLTQKYDLVDGRHRLRAYKNLGMTEVLAEIVPLDSRAQIITEAFLCNVGGAKPPTSEDKEHTVMMLLQEKVSAKDIGDFLQLPPTLVRRFVASVKLKIEQGRLKAALKAITEKDISVVRAAEEHQVDPAKLRELIAGRKEKLGAYADMMEKLGVANRSHSQSVSRYLQSAEDAFTDGTLTRGEVDKIYKVCGRHAEKALKFLEERWNRFDAKHKAEERT